MTATRSKYQHLVLYNLKKKLYTNKSKGQQRPGKYLVSVLNDINEVTQKTASMMEGVGIDLGIKALAIVSTDKTYKNINKTKKVKKLEKKLKREQKRLSRKYEFKKKRGEKSATYSVNIAKQVKKVQGVHLKLTSIRKNIQIK